MLIPLNSRPTLGDEVDNAKDIFSIATTFVGGILPDRSYLIMHAGREATVRVVPLNWKSILVACMWVACWVFALSATLLSCLAFLEHAGQARRLILGMIAIVCAGVAILLFVLARSPLIKSASFQRAVRLAIEAKVSDEILECLQHAYGKMPDCTVIHGLPVSSSVIAYVYVDGDIPPRTATKAAKRLRSFVSRRRWRLPEVWPVNVTLPESAPGSLDGGRELGLIAALPQVLPDGWDEDMQTIVMYLGRLNQELGINFVIGTYNAWTETNNDLLTVNTPQPNLITLRTAIGRLAAVARSPRGPRPADACTYMEYLPGPKILRVSAPPAHQ